MDNSNVHTSICTSTYWRHSNSTVIKGVKGEAEKHRYMTGRSMNIGESLERDQAGSVRTDEQWIKVRRRRLESGLDRSRAWKARSLGSPFVGRCSSKQAVLVLLSPPVGRSQPASQPVVGRWQGS